MYGVHIRQNYMSDEIVAHTVIRMSLAYFCNTDTHLKKKFKSLLSLRILQLQRRYRAKVIQLGMVLQGKLMSI